MAGAWVCSFNFPEGSFVPQILTLVHPEGGPYPCKLFANSTRQDLPQRPVRSLRQERGLEQSTNHRRLGNGAGSTGHRPDVLFLGLQPVTSAHELSGCDADVTWARKAFAGGFSRVILFRMASVVYLTNRGPAKLNRRPNVGWTQGLGVPQRLRSTLLSVNGSGSTPL